MGSNGESVTFHCSISWNLRTPSASGPPFCSTHCTKSELGEDEISARNALFRRPALEVSEHLHVAPKTWRAARQVFADPCVSCFGRVFRHAHQVGIRWTANPPRVGEGFGEVGFGKAKEFVLAEFASSIPRHRFALPASAPQSGRPVSRMAMTSFLA